MLVYRRPINRILWSAPYLEFLQNILAELLVDVPYKDLLEIYLMHDCVASDLNIFLTNEYIPRMDFLVTQI